MRARSVQCDLVVALSPPAHLGRRRYSALHSCIESSSCGGCQMLALQQARQGSRRRRFLSRGTTRMGLSSQSCSTTDKLGKLRTVCVSVSTSSISAAPVVQWHPERAQRPACPVPTATRDMPCRALGRAALTAYTVIVANPRPITAACDGPSVRTQSIFSTIHRCPEAL